MNRLLFGDNLKWLRDTTIFSNASVDLVYLDRRSIPMRISYALWPTRKLPNFVFTCGCRGSNFQPGNESLKLRELGGTLG
jgi:hypothetical protein